MSEPLLAEYLCNLDFWRRHFIIMGESIRWAPIDRYLMGGDAVGFWLDEQGTLLAVVTLLEVETDHIQISAWFYQRKAETADWSDYFVGVPSYQWIQIWPCEHEKLHKVLKDAIAMESLAGKPLRAY